MVNQLRQQIGNLYKTSSTKPTFSFFPCVVQKLTAHVDTKELDILHYPQKGFRGIFIGIPQHQKGYLIYVPSTRKIVSSHDVVFDEIFSSELAYISHTFSEEISALSEVLYILYDKSSNEKSGNIINFAKFEEGNLVENECDLV